MLDEMDKTERRNRIGIQRNPPRIVSSSSLTRHSTQSKRMVRSVEKEVVHSLWSLQVGAFDKFSTARLEASKASKILSGLGRTRISIKSNIRRGKRIYRARLVGQPKLKAKKACRFLKRRKIPCLLVRQKKTTAQGDQ